MSRENSFRIRLKFQSNSDSMWDMTQPTSTSLVETAYREVKGSILACDLAPDAIVDEAAIARSLGSSKTPVRQALNRLAAEGFIRILPQRGTLVNRISLADIQQVFFIRQLLEPEASELAARRATPAQVKLLKRLDEEFESSDELNPDLDKHTEFHVAVAAVAGVPRMTKIIAELQEQMQWFMAVRASEGGAMPPRHHHRELVGAIATRNVAQARRITEDSLRQSREELLRGVVGDSIVDLYSPDPYRLRTGSTG